MPQITTNLPVYNSQFQKLEYLKKHDNIKSPNSGGISAY